jgi:hypothetical protein
VLVGHVIWQSRPAQPNPLQQLPITLTLRSEAGEFDYPQQTTGDNGVFTVPVAALAAGTYGWRVEGPRFLANAGTVTIAGAPATNCEMGLMRAGDANNDNTVDVSDFIILKGAFGESSGQPGYDDRADFNGDLLVSIIDYSPLKGNFGLSGAPPLSPRPGPSLFTNLQPKYTR